jgi:hypothetical protein
MADKLTKVANKARLNMWSAFKNGLKIKGYEYYQPPDEITYRYPAPGSSPLNEEDHPNLYKNDWKTPFRQSEYNTTKIEVKLDDEDERQAKNYISGYPSLNPNGKRGDYDQNILNEAIPRGGQEVLFEGKDLSSEEMRNEIWKEMESRPEQMNILRRDYAPTQHDYNDSYNQVNALWHTRGVTGLDNNPRMKEMFVEMENMIENNIGVPQIKNKQMKMYKGTTKKWQILDDAVYTRDQIEKLQAAVHAPSPAQLEAWKAKHDVPLKLPATNATVSQWRDEPLAIESADFDPQAILAEKQNQTEQFFERYEIPQQLSEGKKH